MPAIVFLRSGKGMQGWQNISGMAENFGSYVHSWQLTHAFRSFFFTFPLYETFSVKVSCSWIFFSLYRFWFFLENFTLYCIVLPARKKRNFSRIYCSLLLSPDLLNCSLSLCLFAIVHFTLICLLDRMSKRRVSFPGLIEQPPLFCKSSIHLIAMMGTSWGWSCAKLSLAFS